MEREDGRGGEGEPREDGSGDGSESLRRVLEERGRDGDRISENERRAEELREQARRLRERGDERGESEDELDSRGGAGRGEDVPRALEGMGDGMDKGDGDGAGDGERGEGAPEGVEGPTDFVPVDAAGDRFDGEDGLTPIGRADAPGEGDGGGVSGRSERIRRAARRARERLEDREIPRARRDLIREYFRAIEEDVGRAAPVDRVDGADAPDPGSGDDS